MSARMAAVTGQRPRRTVTCARSVIGVGLGLGFNLGLGLAAATMLAAFCVGGVAKAESQQTFEGRWVASNRSLTLDLSRCGDGWCGIEVTQTGACGRTVLRARVDDGRLTGRLELATKSQPYTIAMHLVRHGPNEPETLAINGHTGAQFEPWRRMYPYMVMFARTGDVTCRPDPKVS
jgi:hypothetical protein